jgi:glycosyltransferase involved in cell wall biosynthesis
MIMKMMVDNGYKVEFAARGNYFSPSITNQLPSGVKLTNNITSECDIFMLYASDMVFDYHKPEFNIMSKLNAKKKVMALTYKIGKAANTEWADHWDNYLFLSTEMKNDFLSKVYFEAMAEVLPPPVDLTEFFKLRPNGLINGIVRHSSQSDKKYDKRLIDIINACPGTTFNFMPPPSFLNGAANVKSWPYNGMSVPEFLLKGSVFWYLLPEGYTDQGPRAVMEAMAAGLPVITENRSGMADRVNEDTGWFVNYDSCADLINSLSLADVMKKGLAARKYARENFNPQSWVREIT